MINTNSPTMANLFEQLGLSSDEAAISTFIERNKLDASVHIEDAPFWTESQKAFITFELEEDAEWAELIDQLNLALH